DGASSSRARPASRAEYRRRRRRRRGAAAAASVTSASASASPVIARLSLKAPGGRRVEQVDLGRIDRQPGGGPGGQGGHPHLAHHHGGTADGSKHQALVAQPLDGPHLVLDGAT